MNKSYLTAGTQEVIGNSDHQARTWLPWVPTPDLLRLSGGRVGESAFKRAAEDLVFY